MNFSKNTEPLIVGIGSTIIIGSTLYTLKRNAARQQIN